jgi:predicted esterase
LPSEPSSHVIETPTHGRYLLRPPTGHPSGVLIGFHGYKESADHQMARLVDVPGSSTWLLISIQGLNRFYRGRTDEVIAGWMTRQDREHAIHDNLTYVMHVLDEVSRRHATRGPFVFAGFSQGVAMAFRAACGAGRDAMAIAVGGDIPPELEGASLGRISAALLVRGERDGWYTDEKLAVDCRKLEVAGTPIQRAVIDAAHEWTNECGQLIGDFLKRRARD